MRYPQDPPIVTVATLLTPLALCVVVLSGFSPNLKALRTTMLRVTDGLRVEKVPSGLGKDFIKKHHYSKGVHNGPITYGLFDEDNLVGVIAFATPSSEAVCASVFGPERKRQVTELHRLVLLDSVPKNGESFFIARALKLLKKDRPYYSAVLSFADSTQGHVGTIYQACNAIYCGTTAKATFYLDQDGRLRHPRQSGVNISKQVAAERGWTAVKREAKHRYLFLLPSDKREKKLLEKTLLLKPQPYPTKPEA